MKKRILTLALAMALILALVPVAAAESEAVFVSFGGNTYPVVVSADGGLWTWAVGEDDAFTPSFIQLGTENDWKSATSDFAVKNDGSLWSWGYAWGNDGNEPKQVSTDTWVSVSKNMGIKSDGSLWSLIGFDYETRSVIYEPEQIGTDTDWVNIAAGPHHTVALKTDGSLWAWGWNYGGQLGDGTTTDRSEPGQIGTDKNWASIAAGVHHTFAIKTDGSLWAWGWDETGQIGTDTDWVSVTANGDMNNMYIALAIKADGSLWSLVNYDRETWSYTYTPERIGVDNDWTSAAVNCYGTYYTALKTNGSLWAWELGSYEEWGDPYSSVGMIWPATSTPAPQATPYPNVGVTLDGEKIPVAVFGINGNIYLKLRDLAVALDVHAEWDASVPAVRLDSTRPTNLTPSVDPLPADDVPAASRPDVKVFLNGTEINATVFGIEGNTILGLGDIARALNLNPNWDGETSTAVLTRAGS